MYKIWHAFTYLLLKEIVANERLIGVVRTGPLCSTSGGVVCWPVSTLKATDLLNITYDCYSQNNNVERSAL